MQIFISFIEPAEACQLRHIVLIDTVVFFIAEIRLILTPTGHTLCHYASQLIDTDTPLSPSLQRSFSAIATLPEGRNSFR